MTRIIYTKADATQTVLESPRDPFECVDWLRSRWFPETPLTPDEAFATAKRIQRGKKK